MWSHKINFNKFNKGSKSNTVFLTTKELNQKAVTVRYVGKFQTSGY